ncbi:right-handed parallel beta-helix repeat-containing protein [Haloechinothrix salitolerans]|uniref:Right-handed parallel beta-helix repeat-containing protein n=1 Tax=Haloechinothrix salitolerans TaxID=926830 RepID=A0ABW2C3M1_9PSEU
MFRCTSLITLVVALLFGAATPALAHEERESQFPPGDGSVPVHRGLDEAADVLVVCKPDSRQRIRQLADPRLRRFNRQLLAQCEFQHLQAAVNAVAEQGTNIYVLPGEYREEPSWDPPCTKDYDGGVVDYVLMTTCGEVVNLVTITGDDPDDPDITCDNARCDLQIEGTGDDADDVTFTGGFRENGDWVKHNGLKADRADGFYLANVTFELFRENAIYVHETDGYALDDVVARKNDLYGILTFTSDHGLITDCETSYNGDSGVYPGSPADVNSQDTNTGPLQRWSVEITGCDTHHNALGFSGTAGNSVYFHGNDVHHNGAGYVTDSVVGDHPGMPQDHAWLKDNQIYSNNVNYYPNVQEGGPCTAEKPADRGHEDGVVCPAFPVPVGTGVMIAGGNHNFVTSNEIYDNWRNGVMLFWAPAAIRGEYDPTTQQDNPHRNAFTKNQMGYQPGGAVLPNGLDFWWDDSGNGNCWDSNLAAPGAEITHNAIDPRGLPGCPTGSMWPIGNVVKSAQLLPCSQYNRESNPDPVGCDWMDTPPRPGSSEGSLSTMSMPSQATTASGIGVLLAAAALGLVAWRRKRAGTL